MQSALFDIINEDGGQFPEIETQFSFEPFLNYLKERTRNEISIKKNFFENVLHEFKLIFEVHGTVNEENIVHFEISFLVLSFK